MTHLHLFLHVPQLLLILLGLSLVGRLQDFFVFLSLLLKIKIQKYKYKYFSASASFAAFKIFCISLLVVENIILPRWPSSRIFGFRCKILVVENIILSTLNLDGHYQSVQESAWYFCNKKVCLDVLKACKNVNKLYAKIVFALMSSKCARL